MPRSYIIFCLGLFVFSQSIFAQQNTKLDSLRAIIIEYSTDSIQANEEELTTVSAFLKLAKDENSTEDIILAYQQLAALNYTIGHTNKALHYYRLFVLEQNQYANNLKSKGITFRENLAENEIRALANKVELLEVENSQLKSSQAEFFEKNSLIFLGLKIIVVISFILLVGWLYIRIKRPKKLPTPDLSEISDDQLSKLLDETKEKLIEAETEHDLSDILVEHTIIQPYESFNANKSIHKKFLIHQSKKLTGGDGLLFSSSKQKTLIAVFDAPGFGATGNLLSSLIYSKLNDLVRTHKIESPDLVLKQLEINLFKTFPAGVPFTGGINIGICLYNAARKVISYSAANMELFAVQKGFLHHINGAPHSLLIEEEAQEFDLIEIDVTRNSNFYFCTSGFWNQHGGHDNKPFGKASFEKTIESLSSQHIREHESVLNKILSDWKGGNEQDDDILVLGFGF
ncbi:MAG: hypothetical protein DRI71_05165 [Bacteroidetes bacterium]|nr:MAG: hypothetical protein DRI71_05165 [Bacteroidota bacterium]